MGDIYDERSCAVPLASLDMTDRPRHRILIEYNRIEIACAEHCLEVLRVIACAEPRGNERQRASQRKNSRIWPARHNAPLDPTLERFCGRSDEAAEVASPMNVTDAPAATSA